MSAEDWFLVGAVSVVLVSGAFFLGRFWGYVQGRRSQAAEAERRHRAREAYLEQRLQEYVGMLEAVVSENERLNAVAADPADWWKTGQPPPEVNF